MSQALADRVTSFLEEQRVPYEVLPHRRAFTSQDVAASLHVSGWNVAKVVVVHEQDAPSFMVVLPASCRLDLAALESVTGRKHLSLASEAEMRELFPDCELGAMPPFGSLYGMPVYVDAGFPRGKDFLFQAGNHHEVLRTRYEDFARVAKPVVVDIACH